jgi:hypothetical protein
VDTRVDCFPVGTNPDSPVIVYIGVIFALNSFGLALAPSESA